MPSTNEEGDISGGRHYQRSVGKVVTPTVFEVQGGLASLLGQPKVTSAA